MTWTPGGSSADLSGATAEMAIAWDAMRYTRSTQSFAIEAGSVGFSTADGDIVINNEADTITVFMTNEQTSQIQSSDCNYQLRVMTADGAKTTVAAGKVLVRRDFIG